MNTLKLVNVNLNTLKSLFDVMSKVDKTSNTLNFTLSTNGMFAVNSNDASSVFKFWEISYDKFSESKQGTLETDTKVSIFNGDVFVKKILPLFGQIADIEFEIENGETRKLTLTKVNQKGKVELRIPITCGVYKYTWKDFPQELLNIIFDLDNSNQNTQKINLRKEDIINIRKLSILDTNTEEQKKYVKIYGDEYDVRATDNSFDVVLTPNLHGYTDNIEIDKSLLHQIDPNDYEVKVQQTDDLKFIIMNRTDENWVQKISVNLLSEISDDTTWQDYTDFDTEF